MMALHDEVGQRPLPNSTLFFPDTVYIFIIKIYYRRLDKPLIDRNLINYFQLVNAAAVCNGWNLTYDSVLLAAQLSFFHLHIYIIS